MAIDPLAAGASRPFPGETANGDGWRVDRGGHRMRVLLVDGLGHGADAAAVTALALAAAAENPLADPATTIQVCHRALRGAAVAAALIDCRQATATFAGVGNIEARLWAADRERRFVSARGIVGFVLPKLRPDEIALPEGWLLVLHTDGVSAKFRLDELAPDLRSVQALPDLILTRWGRSIDDATVVALGPAPTAVQAEE